MNAVGIDVSKGKSTVAILRPGGEVVASPFEVSHNPRELNELVTLMKSLDGDTKIVMEYTGNYYLPVALFLQKFGLFVSVVNPILVKDYSNKSLSVRKGKTDKKDSIKLASFALDRWNGCRFSPLNPTREHCSNPLTGNTINTKNSKSCSKTISSLFSTRLFPGRILCSLLPPGKRTDTRNGSILSSDFRIVSAFQRNPSPLFPKDTCLGAEKAVTISQTQKQKKFISLPVTALRL